MKPILHTILYSLTITACSALVIPTCLAKDPEVYNIKDRTKKNFRVAFDEVMESTAKGKQIKNVNGLKSLDDLTRYVKDQKKKGNVQPEIVMYEDGKPRNKYTRRVLTGKIYVKAGPDANIPELALAAGMVLKEELPYAPGYYVLETTEPGAELTAYQILNQNKSVKESSPLLGRLRAKKWVPNDPYFTNQWYLLNTSLNDGTAGQDINVTNVWETYRGTNMYIGVIDDGVDLVHIDLFANLNTTIDKNWNTGSGPANDARPWSLSDNHGTQVAGLIAAQANNNNKGCSGTAPEAEMIPMRLLSDAASDLDEAEAFAYSNGLMQVKNNSWGMPDGYGYIGGPGTLAEAALLDGVQNGRGSNGVIYVFSGGNGLQYSEDANLDGYANSPYTISVAAVTKDGTQPWYGEPGACHVISTPGGEADMITTDRVGDEGDNTSSSSNNLADTSYTKRFTGTSAAAPVASGGIALILQAAPSLGWRDVQEILIATARMNDPDDTDWYYNSAGYHFNHKYGPGVLDVEAAIATASSWSNLGPRVASDSITNLNLVIPDNDSEGVLCSFAVTNSIRVEHAILSVDITHQYRGDIRAVLTSPAGTESVLVNVSSFDTNANLYGWSFNSVRQWGENSSGTWTLLVSDMAATDTGVVDVASLQLFGTDAGTGLPPTLKYIDDLSIGAGRTDSIVITASDYVDDDQVTLSATGLPEWADFPEQTASTVVSNTFSFTPSSTGIFEVVFLAGDADGTTTQKISITVSEFPVAAEQENFSSPGIPTGWTVNTNGDASAFWRFDNPATRANNTGGDSEMAIADSDNAGSVNMDTELITPVMNLSDYTSVFLEYKSDFRPASTEKAEVDISTNGITGPWINVWTENGNFRGPIERDIDISAQAAGQTNVAVRFHYYDANYAWWWQLDDIEVTGYKTSDADGDMMPGWWEDMFFGNETNASWMADQDSDGMNNRDEYYAGTVPTNAGSVFKIASASNTVSGTIELQWSSIYGRSYSLSRSTNISTGFLVIESNIVATPPSNTYVDPTNRPSVFYRINID